MKSGHQPFRLLCHKLSVTGKTAQAFVSRNLGEIKQLRPRCWNQLRLPAVALAIVVMWPAGVCGADLRMALEALDRGDYSTASRELQALAREGDPEAQFFLAGMYVSGKGLPKDLSAAFLLYLSSASQGYAAAQYSVGYAYYWGDGVQQDYRKAAFWIERGAQQRDDSCQFFLALLYAKGQGVIQDSVQAHMWANVAALSGWGKISTQAASLRESLSKQMMPEQIAEAERLARNWRPRTENNNSTPPGSRAGAEGSITSGSGFVIGHDGRVLTNQHVVDGCTQLGVLGPSGRVEVSIIAEDKQNDMAVVGTVKQSPVSLGFTGQPVKLGQNVIVLGYPLQGLLTSSVSVTTGTISALAGVQDDTRMLQITAPVQPGNSGGPLLDQTGAVVGMVTSKLDALKTAKLTGDVPQNVNFAIKAATIRAFLDASGVEYSTLAPTTSLETVAVVERAKKAVVRIECRK